MSLARWRQQPQQWPCDARPSSNTGCTERAAMDCAADGVEHERKGRVVSLAVTSKALHASVLTIVVDRVDRCDDEHRACPPMNHYRTPPSDAAQSAASLKKLTRHPALAAA